MILVAGISGSGKTFTLQRLARLRPEATVVSASGRLKLLGLPLRALTRGQALANQRALAEDLRRSGLAARPGAFLDGHATIPTRDGSIEVPDEWFDLMAFEGLVGIRSAPADIVERRPDFRPDWTPAAAACEQEFERAVLAAQSARLGIPLLDLTAGDAETLADWTAGLSRSAPDAASR